MGSEMCIRDRDVTPVSENCYNVSLSFCATQLSQAASNKPGVMQAVCPPCPLSAPRLSSLVITLLSVSVQLSALLPRSPGHYRQSPAGPGAQARLVPGEHMVTSMGNIIMICIRQQITQHIYNMHSVCFITLPVYLSHPPVEKLKGEKRGEGYSCLIIVSSIWSCLII